MTDWEVIIISLLFSAFFSGIEIAFISANKLRIELQSKQGTLKGKILSEFIKKPSRFLGVVLIGNNIALVIFGIKMAEMLSPWLSLHLPQAFQSGFSSLFLQTIITTAIVLIVGEFLPKVIFRLNPNGLLNFFSIPMRALSYLLYPLVVAVTSASEFFIRHVLKVPFREMPPAFSKIDLEHFIKETRPAEEEDATINTELFENALYLIKVKVRECMVPRTEIQAIDASASLEELRQKFVETGISRLIVYKDTLDNIVGYIHHYALLSETKTIEEGLIPIPLVPESMSANDLLGIFMRENKNIAWVVDEFGGTAGIVTMEDVLEELFGEIQDEHDVEEFIDRQLAADEFLFSGRLEVDYLNEKYSLEIPEGDYETLAGFIMAHHTSIPEMNERLVIGRYEFVIFSVSDTRIETVKLKLLAEDNEG